MSGRWIQPGRGLVATVAIIGSVVVGRHASVRGETAGAPPDVPPRSQPRRAGSTPAHRPPAPLDFSAAPAPTKIPIKHVIVLMQETTPFDHYFGRLQVFGQPEAGHRGCKPIAVAHL